MHSGGCGPGQAFERWIVEGRSGEKPGKGDSGEAGSNMALESPLDCKEIQVVHSEGDQPWDFFGSNDAKAATPILWPPHAKS